MKTCQMEETTAATFWPAEKTPRAIEPRRQHNYRCNNPRPHQNADDKEHGHDGPGDNGGQPFIKEQTAAQHDRLEEQKDVKVAPIEAVISAIFGNSYIHSLKRRSTAASRTFNGN